MYSKVTYNDKNFNRCLSKFLSDIQDHTSSGSVVRQTQLSRQNPTGPRLASADRLVRDELIMFNPKHCLGVTPESSLSKSAFVKDTYRDFSGVGLDYVVTLDVDQVKNGRVRKWQDRVYSIEEWLDRWQEMGIPVPRLTVETKTKGNFQAIWVLRNPQLRMKPSQFQIPNIMIGADPKFTNSWQANPFHTGSRHKVVFYESQGQGYLEKRSDLVISSYYKGRDEVNHNQALSECGRKYLEAVDILTELKKVDDPTSKEFALTRPSMGVGSGRDTHLDKAAVSFALEYNKKHHCYATSEQMYEYLSTINSQFKVPKTQAEVWGRARRWSSSAQKKYFGKQRWRSHQNLFAKQRGYDSQRIALTAIWIRHTYAKNSEGQVKTSSKDTKALAGYLTRPKELARILGVEVSVESIAESLRTYGGEAVYNKRLRPDALLHILMDHGITQAPGKDGVLGNYMEDLTVRRLTNLINNALNGARPVTIARLEKTLVAIKVLTSWNSKTGTHGWYMGYKRSKAGFKKVRLDTERKTGYSDISIEEMAAECNLEIRKPGQPRTKPLYGSKEYFSGKV